MWSPFRSFVAAYLKASVAENTKQMIRAKPRVQAEFERLKRCFGTTDAIAAGADPLRLPGELGNRVAIACIGQPPYCRRNGK